MDAQRLLLCKVTVVAVAVALASCIQSRASDIESPESQSQLLQQTQLDMDRKVDVVASIESFDEQGWRDHFEDGGYAAYSISSLRILSPKKHEGRILMVRVSDSEAADSVWRTEGASIRFEMSVEVLDSAAGEKAFVGQNFIKNLRVEKLN